MSKTTICDVCGARSPDLKVKAHVKRWMFDGWNKTYDLCEECWAIFQVWAASNPPKGKQ